MHDDVWIPGAVERRDAKQWERENMSCDDCEKTRELDDIEEAARDIRDRADSILGAVAGTESHPLYPVLSYLAGIADAATAMLDRMMLEEIKGKIFGYEETLRKVNHYE